MEKYLKLFAALSDETRLRIFLILSKGELCVCELTGILDMEQSRISHSLRILKEASLIERRREGKWIVYRTAPGMLKNKIIRGVLSELPPHADLPDGALIRRKGSLRERCWAKK